MGKAKGSRANPRRSISSCCFPRLGLDRAGTGYGEVGARKEEEITNAD